MDDYEEICKEDIEKVFILSYTEFTMWKDNIPSFKTDWWLSDSNSEVDDVGFIKSNGSAYTIPMERAKTYELDVYPCIKLLDKQVKPNSLFMFNNKKWRAISENVLICLSSLGQSPFRTDDVSDSYYYKDYKTSAIKNLVDIWFNNI